MIGDGVMRFLIDPNPLYESAVRTAKVIEDALKKEGHTCVPAGEGDAADMLIVIGGDGTVLRAVRENKNRLPIWAVNAGHVGYLTDCGAEEALDRLPVILRGESHVEERLMLSGIYTGGSRKERFFALNECCIHRTENLHGVHISFAVDGKHILSFRGDGILVSSPTGSTAYNLSAGGPILLPEANELVITPICPQYTVCMPLVVTGESRVSIQTDENRMIVGETYAKLVIDGVTSIDLSPGDRVDITKAPWRMRFVRTVEDDFYQKLQYRLKQSDDAAN